jgi:hypothetical protein
MIQRAATFARPVLELPVVRRTRRNHGLEHATITILSQRVANLRMAGRSDASGFILIGEVETAPIERAAAEALRRMRAGEHDLAVHPNCGTNLVTTSALATGAALLGFSGANRRGDWLNRIGLVMALIIPALVFGQPLGLRLQKHFTTNGDPGDLEIVRVSRTQARLFGLAGQPVTVHRVHTRGG